MQGNNRCVHVHLARVLQRCRRETATPSQIGREPTECTHICSVESGCIRDIDLLRTEQHFLLARHSMRKIPQPQVELSHRFHRRRSCHGHGLIREENLLDGRLSLHRKSRRKRSHPFTEIIEYLPTAIARVEEGKDGEKVEDEEEKNLSITNWSCPEYVQDEEGRWPLEGTYEFKAELPEGMSWQRAWTRWWWKCP